MKKKITIAAVVVLLAAAAFAAFWYFRSGNPVDPGTELPPPPAGAPSLTPVSEKAVARYWTEGETVYLVARDGRISKIVNEVETLVSDQTITDLRSAMESPDGKRLLASFGPSRTPTFSVFDIGAGKWSPLPAGTTAAAWSPSGAEVAYLVDGPSDSLVAMVNVSTNRKTELLRLAGGDFSLSWVTPKKIYLVEKPSAQYPVSSWSLDVAARTLAPLMDSANGLSVRWNEAGSAALVFTNTFKENNLAITTGTGKLISLVPFTTIPEKCAFVGDSVYCAVPISIPPGTLLPDDFLTKSVHFSDDIVTWAVSGAPATIYQHGAVPIDAEQLTVSADNKKIRFVNRYDGKLYEISVGD